MISAARSIVLALAVQVSVAPGLIDDRVAEAFLSRLQRAVDGHDRRAVAAMIEYPITVLVSGWQIPVKNASEMLELYNLFFTPEMRCLIDQSGVPRAGAAAPAYPAKLATDGMLFANGLLWAQLGGPALKIRRLAVPPGAPMRFVSQAPRRVAFPSGAFSQRPAQFQGILTRDDVESFVVAGKKGQTLQVRIDGFRGRDAVVRVRDQKRNAVDAQPEGRTWTGALPATADYRVDVARLAPYCDPPLQYTLTVTLR